MKCLGLHNKPTAEVHPGHMLRGPKEEEEEEEEERRDLSTSISSATPGRLQHRYRYIWCRSVEYVLGIGFILLLATACSQSICKNGR
jgi:hypothetical protein